MKSITVNLAGMAAIAVVLAMTGEADHINRVGLVVLGGIFLFDAFLTAVQRLNGR